MSGKAANPRQTTRQSSVAKAVALALLAIVILGLMLFGAFLAVSHRGRFHTKIVNGMPVEAIVQITSVSGEGPPSVSALPAGRDLVMFEDLSSLASIQYRAGAEVCTLDAEEIQARATLVHGYMQRVELTPCA